MGGKAKSTNNASLMFQMQQANEAKQKEAERKARLEQGQASINKLFDPQPVMGERDATFDWSKFDPTASYARSASGGYQLTPKAANYGLPEGYTYKSGGVYDPSGALMGSGYDRDSLAKAIGNFAYKEKYDTGQKAGGFGDDFYNKFRQTQLDFYQPELERQTDFAKRDLTFNLARSGILRSTAAANKQGEIEYEKALQQAGIVNNADQATARMKETVQGQKKSLIDQLYATEDPTLAANLAQTSANGLQLQTPTLDPNTSFYKAGISMLGGALNSMTSPYAYGSGSQYANKTSAGLSSGSSGTNYRYS